MRGAQRPPPHRLVPLRAGPQPTSLTAPLPSRPSSKALKSSSIHLSSHLRMDGKEGRPSAQLGPGVPELPGGHVAATTLRLVLGAESLSPPPGPDGFSLSRSEHLSGPSSALAALAAVVCVSPELCALGEPTAFLGGGMGM